MVVLAGDDDQLSLVRVAEAFSHPGGPLDSLPLSRWAWFAVLEKAGRAQAGAEHG